jgi:methyl-accepting chemotaxis protein
LIATAASHIADVNALIATAVGEQKKASEDIEHNIKSINDVSSTASVGVEKWPTPVAN